jgi:phage host-nuclease inhibitor protein Gam
VHRRAELVADLKRQAQAAAKSRPDVSAFETIGDIDRDR